MTSTGVVVVSHNSAGEIADCLTAVVDPDRAVVMIDNDSSDDTIALVRRQFPGVVVVANPGNIGFARAVNQGVRLLPDVDQVVLLNPDCTVSPGTVDALTRALETRPDVVVAAPRLVDPAGRTIANAHRFESVWSVAATRFGGSLLPRAVRSLITRTLITHTLLNPTMIDSGRPAATGPDLCCVDWVSGACLAIRSETLRALGGLSERYFLYYEDEDLCRRARDLGLVVQLPAVTATHVGGASSRPGETWPHLYCSMIDYFDQHHPGWVGAVRKVIMVRAVLGLVIATARTVGDRDDGNRRRGAWRAVLSIAGGGPECAS